MNRIAAILLIILSPWSRALGTSSHPSPCFPLTTIGTTQDDVLTTLPDPDYYLTEDSKDAKDPGERTWKNRLRALARLPQFPSASTLRYDDYDIAVGAPDQNGVRTGELGMYNFRMKGDTITEIFPKLADLSQEEMAYHFHGDQLIGSEPITIPAMKRLPKPYVKIIRLMTPWELARWKEGAPGEIARSWDPKMKQVRRSDRGLGSFWSVASPLFHKVRGNVKVELVVPRSLLVDLAEKGELKVGRLQMSPEADLLEIWIPEDAWDRLVPFFSGVQTTGFQNTADSPNQPAQASPKIPGH